METKTWLIPLLMLILGLMIGFIIDFPNKFEIKVEVVNETRDWYDNVWDDFNSTVYDWKNICCYPSDCTEAKNNPDKCTCIYMVECFNETEAEEIGVNFPKWNSTVMPVTISINYSRG